MKLFFTLFTVLIATGFSFAQAPMKTTVEYNGQKYPCYIIEYNLPQEETEKVIKQKLKTEGYNPDKSKGFLVYRNMRFKNLKETEPQDVFFKIERKSRKENDKSIVTMITSKAGSIPEEKVKGAKMVADIESSPYSLAFINSFQKEINLQSHYLSVSAQEDEVAKAEKILKNLQESQIKLEKKIKDYQLELEVNIKDQKKQEAEIKAQKNILSQKKNENPME